MMGPRLSLEIPLRTKTRRWVEAADAATARSLTGYDTLEIPLRLLNDEEESWMCLSSQKITVRAIGNNKARMAVEIGAL